MNPEKYKTNKSSLNKFLEKRNAPPTDKNFEKSKNIQTTFFKKLQEVATNAYDNSDFETLARLDASGCVINLGILISVGKLPRDCYEFFQYLERSDRDNNNRILFSQTSIWGSLNGRTYYSHTFGTGYKDERYTVAGKTYANKTEFYAQRTELGRALT